MASDHDITVLNSLIKTTLDSVKGFRDAADDAENNRYQAIFLEFAQERSEVASTLQAEVRRLGGNPEDDSSLLAAAHRTFMDLKQAVMGNSDKAVIQEVERGEDYIKEKYQTALADTGLSPEVRQVVQQASTSIQRGHERARQLKASVA
jgi:uncharacterized protein (TIGR02284 family)